MYLQKGISIKTLEKKIIFCWCLKGHWRKEQDPEPDPLVKGTDPMKRIRTKILRIERISDGYHRSMPKKKVKGTVAEKKPEIKLEQKILHPMCKFKMLRSTVKLDSTTQYLDLTLTKKSHLISFEIRNDFFRIQILLFSWIRILHEFFLIFLK
jgi:hypothetical protein